MITQDQVKELFEYRAGELYWKVKPAQRVKIGDKAGTAKARGYIGVKIKRKLYPVHRLIFLMFYGYLPNCIDHIDNNPSNNKIENLRLATLSENQYNAKVRKDNKSGVKGVNWHKNVKKWCVQLVINGKTKHFGSYHDIQIAKFIAETMRYKYHGAFANHG
jgi:hypothetical protein